MGWSIHMTACLGNHLLLICDQNNSVIFYFTGMHSTNSCWHHTQPYIWNLIHLIYWLSNFQNQTPTVFPSFQVITWLLSVNAEAFNSIKDHYVSSKICGQETTASFYVPEPVVQVMLPNLLDEFYVMYPRIASKLLLHQLRPAYSPVLFFWLLWHTANEFSSIRSFQKFMSILVTNRLWLHKVSLSVLSQHPWSHNAPPNFIDLTQN